MFAADDEPPPIERIEVPNDLMEQLAGTWSMRNACVAFYSTQKTTYRAHWISRQQEAAIVSGFSEYNSRFHRLTWLRPETPGDRLEACATHPLALAFSFSSNNIYHQFFHAVPAWLALSAQAERNPDATMVPLVSIHAGNWTGPERHWAAHAWQFSVRALTKAAPQTITANLGALLGARCTCFDRVEGNTGAFEPRAPLALGSLRRFCLVALRNAAGLLGSAPGERRTELLYVSRAGGRKVVNDAAALSALRLDNPSVRRVILEQLPVVQQMQLISDTLLLVTQHGQALAWMPFMTIGDTPAAVVEIQLPFSKRTWVSTFMYGAWAVSLRIGHTLVQSTNAATCTKRQHDDLKCDVVVDLPKLTRAVRDMRAWLAAPPAREMVGSRLSRSMRWCSHRSRRSIMLKFHRSCSHCTTLR